MRNKVIGTFAYCFSLFILCACTIPSADQQGQGNSTELHEQLSAPSIFKLIDDNNLIAIKQRYALDKTIFRQIDGTSPFLYAVKHSKFAIADFIIDNTVDDENEATEIFANKGESREKTILVLLEKSSSNSAAGDVTRKYLKYRHVETTLAGLTDQAVKQDLISRAKQTQDREIITSVTRMLNASNSGKHTKTSQAETEKSKVKNSKATKSTLNTAERRKRAQDKRDEDRKKRFDQFIAQIRPDERIEDGKLVVTDPRVVLGMGARGQIFEAQYDGKDAAVKVAKSNFEEDLLAEARNLAKLQTAYAPKYFGIMIGDGVVGFVMERGCKSLEKAIRAKQIIQDDVLLQAAKNMIALHAELTHHQINYSDVKPQNLLIMNDGSIKAIDIGGGHTYQYVGSYGQKMARSLLEAKLRTHLKPQYHGHKRSKAFEKYVARVVYRRATNLADVDDIKSLDDLFKKMDLPNKSEAERKKVFYYNEYGKDDRKDFDKMKLGAKAPEGLKDMFLDYSKREKMSPEDREREVFTEALEDTFSGDPLSQLKQELSKLYALPPLPKR